MTIWSPQLEGTKGPRYLAIVEALAQDFASGRLGPGSRLPTHRDLAERLGVTVGTVSRAYAEAARRGLVSGEVGRGTFVRGSGDPSDPGAEAEGVVDLGQNHPPDPPSQPQRAALLDALASLTARRDAGRLLDYPAAGGDAADREAGASWIGRSGVDGVGRRRARVHREPARPHRRPRDTARAGRPPADGVAHLRRLEVRGGPAAPAPPGPSDSTPAACGRTRSRTPAARGARRRSTSSPPTTTRRPR